MLAFSRGLCLINHSNEKLKRRRREASGFTVSSSSLFSTGLFHPPPQLLFTLLILLRVSTPFPSSSQPFHPFIPLHHLSVSECRGSSSQHWPTFGSLFLFTMYVLCSRAPKLRNVAGCMHGHTQDLFCCERNATQGDDSGLNTRAWLCCLWS